MLDDEFLAFCADDQQVLENDLRAGILDHANRFVAAGNLAVERFVTRHPRGRFLHVEADLVIARHGKDGFAVALEMRPLNRFPAILDRPVGKCRGGDQGRGEQGGAKKSSCVGHGVLPQNWKLSDTLALRPGRV